MCYIINFITLIFSFYKNSTEIECTKQKLTFFYSSHGVILRKYAHMRILQYFLQITNNKNNIMVHRTRYNII